MANYPLFGECEVLVCGGGPAGTAAAITAGRNNLKTILIEKNGFLGGNLTAAGIDTIYGLYTIGEKPKKIIGGVTDEIIQNLTNQNACYTRENTYGAGNGLTFLVEPMKVELETLVLNAGGKILYHTFGVDAFKENNGSYACVIASKSGLQIIRTKIIVDTTGDADLIARAGGKFEKAADSKDVQSCTTVFYMANVNVSKAKSFGKQNIWEKMREVNQSGEFDLPRLEGSFHATLYPSMIEANMTRIANVDTTDNSSVTDAEIQGRLQAQNYTNFLIKYIPGFENAFLVKTGCQLGMREGRRIIGKYVLNKEDIISGRKFPDSITRCSQPIEDHLAGKNTRWIYVGENDYYDIPYRCILPSNLDGFITAGRCLSATHDAHASARSSGTAFSLGQAAGMASALSIKKNVPLADINIQDLQGDLRKIGAIL